MATHMNDRATPPSSTPAAPGGSNALEKRIWQALEHVKDPEIPVLSVIEMGMIARVHAAVDGVTVEMTPTFAGCPALDLIRGDIQTVVSAVTDTPVAVDVVYDPPWTTDRITEIGRRKLKAFGLAPPARSCKTSGTAPEPVQCPHCDSTDTRLESLFGPTLCRSIHYCHRCLQSFEHFKTV